MEDFIGIVYQILCFVFITHAFLVMNYRSIYIYSVLFCINFIKILNFFVARDTFYVNIRNENKIRVFE